MDGVKVYTLANETDLLLSHFAKRVGKGKSLDDAPRKRSRRRYRAVGIVASKRWIITSSAPFPFPNSVQDDRAALLALEPVAEPASVVEHGNLDAAVLEVGMARAAAFLHRLQV